MDNLQQPKIAILIPYFGNLPWYFKFFIHSAAYNQTIQFFLITDQYLTGQFIPENVCIIYKSFGDVKQLFSEKLGLNVAFNNPHKICDFKPTYGFVFQDLIKDFDFWGYCDIDLIFGDIRSFMSAEILEQYDVISVLPEYLSGAFALFKNTKQVNSLFEQSIDYREILTNDQYQGFDECGELCFELMEGASLESLPAKIESMTHLLKLKLNDQVRTHFDHYIIEGLVENLKWERGTLTYAEKYEVLLYHLIWYKAYAHCQVPSWETIPELFYIHKDNFSIG